MRLSVVGLTPAVSIPSACWPVQRGFPGAAAVLGQFHSLSALTSSELPSFCPRLAGPKPRVDSFVLSGLNQVDSGAIPSGLPTLFGRRVGNQMRTLLCVNTPLNTATPLMASFSGVWGTNAPEAPELGRQGKRIKRRGCLLY